MTISSGFGGPWNLADDIECVLVFLLIVDGDVELELRRDPALQQADEAVILLCPNGDDWWRILGIF
jgi:hypothetical protein